MTNVKIAGIFVKMHIVQKGRETYVVNAGSTRVGEAYVSKTDKTTPYWVWAKQNPDGWNRRYAKMMYLFPRPKREQVCRARYNSKERNRVRMAMLEVIKAGPQDCDFQNFPHRHSALWDTF